VVEDWSSYWHIASATWCFSLQRLSSKLVLRSLKEGATLQRIALQFGTAGTWMFLLATMMTLYIWLVSDKLEQLYWLPWWPVCFYNLEKSLFWMILFGLKGGATFALLYFGWVLPFFLLSWWPCLHLDGAYFTSFDSLICCSPLLCAQPWNLLSVWSSFTFLAAINIPLQFALTFTQMPIFCYLWVIPFKVNRAIPFKVNRAIPFKFYSLTF
jgi:hypothetical protein